jgi:hypothetical protein
MRDLDPAKTIVALGSYGYEWVDGPGHGKEVSFQEAVMASRDSEAEITFDPPRAIHSSNLMKTTNRTTPSGFLTR